MANSTFSILDPLDWINHKVIAKALQYIDRPSKLGELPLATNLAYIAARCTSTSYPLDDQARGNALAAILHELIQEIQPSGEWDRSGPWRQYDIIYRHYLLGETRTMILNDLRCSVAEYHNDQKEALQRLAELLKKRAREWDATAWPRGYHGIFTAPSHLRRELFGRPKLVSQILTRLVSGVDVRLYGGPGIGKTALALRVAYDRSLLEHFSGGVLWAALGPTPNLEAQLALWAALLGVSYPELQQVRDLAAWSELVQARIGDRPMLLVADDAWSQEAINTIAACKGPNSTLLVTTRDTELARPDGLPIPDLDIEDGVQLIRAIARHAVEDDLEAAYDLVQLVGGRPLALVLLGSYLTTTSTPTKVQIRSAIQKVKDAKIRLERITTPVEPLGTVPSLSPGTPITLMAVIAVSDEALQPHAQAALRALAFLPPKPNTFGYDAALSITATTEQILESLLRSSLLETSGPARMTMHRTVADYARINASKEHITFACSRMVEFFIAYVEQYKTNYRKLDPELNNLRTAMTNAETNSMEALFIHGANASAPYLNARGLYEVSETWLQTAEQMALAHGEQRRLNETRINLGRAKERLGKLDQALQVWDNVLNLARILEDNQNVIRALLYAGGVLRSLGELTTAIAYLDECLTLSYKEEETDAIRKAHINLSGIALQLGDYLQADKHCSSALALLNEQDDPEDHCTLLNNLGTSAFQQGHINKAETFWEKAFSIANDLEHPDLISAIHQNLSLIGLSKADFNMAVWHAHKGLEIAKRIKHFGRTLELLNNLGTALTNQGNLNEAEPYLSEALTMASRLPQPSLALVAVLSANLADIAAQRRETSKSEQLFIDALVIGGESGYEWLVAQIVTEVKKFQASHTSERLEGAILFAQAQVLHAQGNIMDARDDVEQALAILTPLDDGLARLIREWCERHPSFQRSTI